MRLTFNEQVIGGILLVLLFCILGTYSYLQYDYLYSSTVEINGAAVQVSKLRGFVGNTYSDDSFDFVSGGYQYEMANPYGLELKETTFGDTALYYFDTGHEYVAVHAEYQHFIFLKYLFSLLAFCFVVLALVKDYVSSRGDDYHG